MSIKMDKQILIDALRAKDAARPRSLQKTVGVSSLGGCRRAVWHTLQGDVGTNTTDNLPAILGTAIHAAIEEAFTGGSALLEERVEVDGYPPATIDYFDPATGEVVDWKTIKMSGIPYFISQQKRWQVQCYGFLLAQKGHDVKTVTLVGIPRDGGADDIIVYSEPYDENIALAAFGWLKDIEQRTEAPAPERDATSWCAKYCNYYGKLCAGIAKDLTGDVIVDADLERVVQDYVNLGDEIKMLEAKRDGAKAALQGVTGVTMTGLKVSWSQVKGRETPDMDAIKAALGTVPVKLGMPSMRLMVK